MSPHTIVLDVGKTLSKMTLWTSDGDLVERRARSNMSIATEHYVALDASGIEAWLAMTLAEFAAMARIGAIVPVGHGAAAAIVRNGRLHRPPVDYEQPIPALLRADYDAGRDRFERTGSPLLPNGLNLGAQLHLLEQLDPDALSNGATILPWAQYWSWLLSGIAASEVTSLGCHSDLWNPGQRTPSELAKVKGWAAKLPPLRHASDHLGTILPEWSQRTGLPDDVKIYCGLHDSNAALLSARAFATLTEGDFTVLSTGTWFVAMRSPDSRVQFDVSSLPAGRDCLVNVDVDGYPVPSARFMGGREIQVLLDAGVPGIDIVQDQDQLVAALPKVLRSGAVVLPNFVAGSGPFPDALGRWAGVPATDLEKRAAVGLYAALVADRSLDLIGSRERLLIEGRFAAAEIFVRTLASLRPESEVYVADARIDASYGALRLVNPALVSDAKLKRVAPLDVDLGGLRDHWRVEADRLGQRG